ncbi:MULTISPECIES: ribosome maturation factor RimP [Aphanothece]|uniref:ribosome maturation factor RimP n=1 Tax=Aphanothece TaxID=1121 RepID=UPI003984CA48
MPHPLIPELESLARTILAGLGFELRGVNLQTHRIPMTLQVLAQRGDGVDISLDECASISAPLDEAIEQAGLLAEEPYVLEVSSPGVSDRLHDDRDFRSFRGFPVGVSFLDAKGQETRCQGLLLERTDTELLINLRGRTKRIPRDAVLEVLLVTPSDDN